jgi:hypothetical protein
MSKYFKAWKFLTGGKQKTTGTEVIKGFTSKFKGQKTKESIIKAGKEKKKKIVEDAEKECFSKAKALQTQIDKLASEVLHHGNVINYLEDKLDPSQMAEYKAMDFKKVDNSDLGLPSIEHVRHLKA